MAIQQFESVEAITKHYDRQIKEAGDDELAVANLRAERAERERDFTSAASRTIERRSWVTEAIAKHGIPADLAPMLDRADWSKEDIEKQAERLATVSKAAAAPEPTAGELYGGGGAGGGAAVRTSSDKDGDWLSEFETKWNNREVMAPQDYQRYLSLKLGRHTYTTFKGTAGQPGTGKGHIWGNQPVGEFERF